MEEEEVTTLPRLAVLEVRYPLAPALANADSLERLTELLRPRLPIVRGASPPQFSLSIGQGSMALPQSTFRFMSRDLFTSATVLPMAALIETTSYHDWGEFRGLFEVVLDAIAAISPLQGVERLGLRYINEIRLDGEPLGLEPWRAVVAPEALAPHVLASRLAGYEVKQGFAQSIVGVSDATTTTIRHGLLEGFAVGEGPLKLPTPLLKGPFFLVDIDSSTIMTEPLPPFDRLETLRALDRLHAPVKAIFEGIVDKAFRTNETHAGAQ
jgi:uncharacterized protein (TIGR04255 family)